METAIKTLEDYGATIQSVSLPTTKYALACYYIIAPSECSANLARYDGVKYGYSFQEAADMWADMERTRQHGFGPEVRRRIMLGTYALSAGYYDAYYLKAQQARALIQQDFARVFQDVDALITPVAPTVAFPLGEKTSDPVQMYLSDVCTLPPQHCRSTQHFSAMRIRSGAAGRLANHRASPIRGNAVAGGLRLSASHRVASGNAQLVEWDQEYYHSQAPGLTGRVIL